MFHNKNAVLNFDQSVPDTKWSESLRNGGHLPPEVAQFKANLVMHDHPEKEIDAAIDTVQQDAMRWDGIGSPHFTSPCQIDIFHAYLVECDPELDLALRCPDAKRRLARKIRSRRKWADLASRSGSPGYYSRAFKHYDEGLDALWPTPGSAGFRDFIEESSLAFRQQLADGAIPLGHEGLGIEAHESDKRDYLAQSSNMAVEDALALLNTKLVLACQSEASVYNIEMEAVYFSLTVHDSASALRLLAFFSDLWWSIGRPRLKSCADVEAFIAFGLMKYWRGPAHAGQPVSDSMQFDGRTIRGFCEALMARTIRPITCFARELAAYHPCFEEEDYYTDARSYFDYLRSASKRFSHDPPDDVFAM